jgi:type I restriction-modification system DNA methylase subunit
MLTNQLARCASYESDLASTTTATIINTNVTITNKNKSNNNNRLLHRVARAMYQVLIDTRALVQ